jgi:DNA-binding transcriptional MocR family regulator
MEKLLSDQIADKIEVYINRETYRPGDKLPSLRMIRQQHRVSIGTALEAYLSLCDKGLVISREKSGYFVARKSSAINELPKSITTVISKQKVNINRTLEKVTHENQGNIFISFFNAVPVLDMLPFNAIRRSLQNASRNLQGSHILYESTKGNEKLRELIAKRSFHWNGNLNGEDIIITNGTLEAINICLRAVTRPGETVIVETPCYYGILQCIEQLDLKVIELPGDSEHGIDLKQLENIAKKFKVAACLFVSNFNNPNGVKLAESKKQAIAAFANRTRTPVIDDDIYGDLYFGKNRPGNIKTYDTNGWVLLCSSFSKTLVPGYRMGWCAPGRFTEKVKKIKAATNVSTSSIAQQSLIELLNTGSYDRHLRRMRNALQKQMLLTVQMIEDCFPKGTKLSRPEGGFVIWIEFPKKINAFSFQIKALEQNIDIAPGPIFSSRGDYKNYIRISFHNPWNEKVKKALQKLGSLACEFCRDI